MTKVKIGILYDEREPEGSRYYDASHREEDEEVFQRAWDGKVTNIGGYRVFDLPSELGEAELAIYHAQNIASLLNTGRMERKQLEEHPFGEN